jgi:hypothetical protein
MPELSDLLLSEAERLRPDRIPAFDDILRLRRRHRTVGVVAALATVAVVGAVTLAVPALLSSHNAELKEVPGSQVQGAAPHVLQVDCTPTGPVLPNGPRVSAQPDGVHYTFRNATGASMHIGIALGGETLDAHATKDLSTTRVAPGESSTVACADDIETLKAHRVAVVVEDPSHVYVPVPKCTGTTTIRDFIAPMQGDPVELTLGESYPQAHVVGYPAGSPRQIFTGSVLIAWEGGGTSWSPSQVTDCTGTSPHVVASGIKAPPPTELMRTDEFGLVKALRRTGDGLEVDVDRVDMLGGAEAAAAAAAAGTDVSNDYFLRNDNQTLRTYKISPAAVVWGNITMLQKEPGAQRTTLARWLDFVGSPAAKDTLFHFEISDGLIVGIEEQYRP